MRRVKQARRMTRSTVRGIRRSHDEMETGEENDEKNCERYEMEP